MIADVSKCRKLIPKKYFETHECEPDFDPEKARTDSKHITKNLIYMPGRDKVIPLDLAFARWMVIENKVAVMPCSFFYPKNSKNISD